MISKQLLQHIKQEIDILDVIDYYNIDIEGGTERYWANCVFHSGDNTPSLVFYKDNDPPVDSFNCYGCYLNGDTLQLIIECEKALNDNPIGLESAIDIAKQFVDLSTDNLQKRLAARFEDNQKDLDIDQYNMIIGATCRDILKQHVDKDYYGRLVNFIDDRFKETDKAFSTLLMTSISAKVYQEDTVQQVKDYIIKISC